MIERSGSMRFDNFRARNADKRPVRNEIKYKYSIGVILMNDYRRSYRSVLKKSEMFGHTYATILG